MLASATYIKHTRPIASLDTFEDSAIEAKLPRKLTVSDESIIHYTLSGKKMKKNITDCVLLHLR